MSKQKQSDQMRSGNGFVAALDQSGGSTPKALGLYGISEDNYSSDAEMYDLIHAMRSRIIKSPAFTGDKIVGAILFEMTMDKEIDGIPTATYLWEKRGVVPFLKIDKGLEEEDDGVRLMKPIDNLDALLKRAGKAGIFGTKMRSVIDAASETGIAANVAQQFEIAHVVRSHGLMPIIEPEITITITDKSEAEDILLTELTKQLDALPTGQQVMLKLTLPENPNQYQSLVDHPGVLRIVALSGGYSREVANEKLSQNTGVIASFSRALTEGLSAQQTDQEFNKLLESTIGQIYDASVAG
ncbi:MAG: fructose bisphosphate aldolase [Marinosulfonomonas sp.]|nr:MAG: fructose bisphosphate aldolase [Marinosulfonomonas sp.]